MARAVLAGLLVCLLALAGCEALADVGKLRSDLARLGTKRAASNTPRTTAPRS